MPCRSSWSRARLASRSARACRRAGLGVVERGPGNHLLLEEGPHPPRIQLRLVHPHLRGDQLGTGADHLRVAAAGAEPGLLSGAGTAHQPVELGLGLRELATRLEALRRKVPGSRTTIGWFALT